MSKKVMEQDAECVEVPETACALSAMDNIPMTAPPITLIYCGPAIPGVASHGMLFTSMSESMAQCIKDCPAINSFIVAPEGYVRVKQEAERKGSLLHIQYQVVLKYLQRR